MLNAIEGAVKALSDSIEKIGTPEDSLLRANAIKVLSDAASSAISIEEFKNGEPFFTEYEAKSIAEEMATVGSCPGDNHCEGDPDGPCNVCWLEYLMEAKR